MIRNRRHLYITITYIIMILLVGSFPGSVFAMEAPGGGHENWHYKDTNYQWYYYEPGEEYHTGWLKFDGEWYWFDNNGCMVSGDNRTIDGIQYQFFGNGHMVWNQYIGLRYFDENGQKDESHDIRVIGKTSPDAMDKDVITDQLYNVPRAWIHQFVRDGWQLMFYKKKSYFEAPSTNLGVYYVHHNVDTNYKKAKFTEAEAVLEAFGGYVGYASGCFEENSQRMRQLWAEYPALQNILEIPDYYDDDGEFYFSKLFAAYVDSEKRETIIRYSPEAGRIMGEILLSIEDDQEKNRILEKEKERLKRQAEAEAQRMEQEGYGPGNLPKQE